jgi:hypothetical protein
MFKRLIFHLESPAGLIFPKVSRPDPLRCYDMSLFQAYRRHVLQSFQLLNVAPPPIPTVTLILRRRTEKVTNLHDEVVACVRACLLSVCGSGVNFPARTGDLALASALAEQSVDTLCFAT